MYVLYTTPKETRQRPTRTLIATCTVVEICILNTGQRTYTVYWIQGNGNIDEYMFYTRKETPQRYISRKETCTLNTGRRTYTRIHVLYTERDISEICLTERDMYVEYRTKDIYTNTCSIQHHGKRPTTSAGQSREYWIQRKRHIHTTLTCFFPCCIHSTVTCLSPCSDITERDTSETY